MVIIRVRRNDGSTERLMFDKPEIAIGRDSAVNEIVINEASVSKSHALIARTSSGVVLTDLKSTNGTLVNGAPIGIAVALRPGDEISVGSMKIWIDPETFSAPRRRYDDPAQLAAAPPLSMKHVDTIASGGAPVVLDGAMRPAHAELGPLGAWLADPSVSQIQCLRYDRIELTRDRRVEPAAVGFESDAALHRAMVRLARTSDRPWMKDELVVERRLADGSRLTAILPPASTCLRLTIRKHDVVTRTMLDLVAEQAMSVAMSEFLARCMSARVNLVVCGPDEHAVHDVVAALACATPPEHRVGVFHAGGGIRIEGRPTCSFGLPGGAGAEAEVGALRTAGLAGFENLLVVSPKASVAASAVVAITGGASGFVVGLRGRTLAKGLGLTVAELILARPGLSLDAAKVLVTHAFEIGIEVAARPDGSPSVNRIAEVLLPTTGAPTPAPATGAAPMPVVYDRFLRTGSGDKDFTFAEVNVAARVVLE